MNLYGSQRTPYQDASKEMDRRTHSTIDADVWYSQAVEIENCVEIGGLWNRRE